MAKCKQGWTVILLGIIRNIQNTYYLIMIADNKLIIIKKKPTEHHFKYFFQRKMFYRSYILYVGPKTIANFWKVLHIIRTSEENWKKNRIVYKLACEKNIAKEDFA